MFIYSQTQNVLLQPRDLQDFLMGIQEVVHHVHCLVGRVQGRRRREAMFSLQAVPRYLPAPGPWKCSQLARWMALDCPVRPLLTST